MKFFEDLRVKRQKVYEGLFGAKALCITGLIIMPAFLLNHIGVFKIFLFLFFWFLAWLSGKKNKPLFTILIILFIVAFNLIFPYGESLFSIGAFRITDGALARGISRAVTLAGLIMLSRITIRHDLKFPGLFGELISESFRLFAVIMNQKQRITRKNLIADIDRMMIDLSSAEIPRTDTPPASRTKPAGFVILAFVTLWPWFLLALDVFFRTRLLDWVWHVNPFFVQFFLLS